MESRGESLGRGERAFGQGRGDVSCLCIGAAQGGAEEVMETLFMWPLNLMYASSLELLTGLGRLMSCNVMDHHV
jgi:hypothetical protein